MKKVLFLAALLLTMVACNNKKGDQNAQSAAQTESNVVSYPLNELLTQADKLIDKKVTVVGLVTHTCKHSGKRCFIVGEDQKTSFRVEAKGEIGGFNRELVGSELAITGVVKERRLTKEYIDQYEEQLNEQKAQEDGSAETCEAELNNINGMRAWMKTNNKDYYSIYYMDGEDYEIIE